MKLIEIATRKKTLTDPRKLVDVAKDYKKNIKAVLDKQLYFYRAAENHRPIMDSDYELSWYEQPARTAKRSSIFGNGNWLLSWVDSTWQNYPKRSMSYFATQSTYSAGHFGRGDQMLLIIPADDVKSFGAMETDFNESSQEAQTLMSGVQKLYASIASPIIKSLYSASPSPLLAKLTSQVFAHRGIDITNGDTWKPTSENVIKYVQALDELIDNLFQIQQRAGEDRNEKVLIKELKEFRSELKELGFETIEDYAKSFTPKAMGAELFTDFGQIKSSPSKDDELWFEGRYLGIYVQDKEETLENLRELLSDL